MIANGLRFWGPLVLCIAVVPTTFAQPRIDRIDGSFDHGGEVVVTGALFGQKSPAAPLRYDNFEAGTVGDRLASQEAGGWYTWGNAGYPKYSNDMQRIPGEQVALQDYDVASNQTIGLNQMDVDTLYVSGWTYRDDYMGTAMYCENVKFWGNFTAQDASGNGVYPQSRLDAYWSIDSGHLYALTETGARAGDTGTGARAYLNEWFRLERYMAIGDPGTPTGVTWAAYNGEKFAEVTGTFWNGGNPYTYWLIGQYFRKVPYDNPDLPVPHVRVYWSELYVDNTLARVEIGDAPTFEACTHREIQIPVAWSGESLTFTGNHGTFANGASVYLFVVDRDGQVSDGVPVTLGVGGGDFGPGQPGQPLRSDS
jgi:hypothetical protein